MILGDFLSRQKHGESDPHEIIPISFSMQEVLHANYYNILGHEQKIQTEKIAPCIMLKQQQLIFHIQIMTF